MEKSRNAKKGRGEKRRETEGKERRKSGMEYERRKLRK